MIRFPCCALLLLSLAVVMPRAGVAQSEVAIDLPARFAIDAERSEIRILVYRAGMLGGLGHNHVISTSEMGGGISLFENPQDTVLDLFFDPRTLQIDRAELRAEEGDDFPGEIPEKDKAGTRKNMLGRKLLNGERYPEIRIQSKVGATVKGELPDVEISGVVRVRDEEFDVTFPANVTIDGDTLTATGEFPLTHAAIGLKPFSAALGTLKVAKSMTIKYRVVAVLQRP